MAVPWQHISKTKTRLLEAAVREIRAHGYAATTVDDICHQAGVSKGSFFHHFSTKDDLAIAAADYWSTQTAGFLAAAAYRRAADPLDRVLGYLQFRATLLTGEIAEYTCLLGTLIQEVHATHPDIRAACERGLAAHTAELTRDIEAARRLYLPTAPWDAESVAYLIQSVLQGSFIFAKAAQGSEVVRANLAHLQRYLQMLFHREPSSG